MKRIVKETFKDGEVQYKVESNRKFFGLIPWKWYTCTAYCIDTPCEAIFNTIEKAKKFCGIEDLNSVVTRKILYKI